MNDPVFAEAMVMGALCVAGVAVAGLIAAVVRFEYLQWRRRGERERCKVCGEQHEPWRTEKEAGL